MLNIVWYKRDLRISDHEPLLRAVEAGLTAPLYIIEPELWEQPVASARQWRFVSRALSALRTQLAIRGAPLLVRTGDAVEILEELRRKGRDITLWSHEETGGAWAHARDQRVAAWAQRNGVAWRRFANPGMVGAIDTDRDWAARWETHIAHPVLAPPDGMMAHGLSPGPIRVARLIGLAADPCEDMPAGPRPARTLLEGFLSRPHEPGDFVTALDAGSRLSPHLAWGTISAREAYHAAKGGYDALPPGPERKPIGQFIERLQWRSRAIQTLADTPEIELRCLNRAHDGMREADHDPLRLDSWLDGQTGLPLVDASMRALKARGSLSFRKRAMLASVAANHLWLDWRNFGPGLARLFTDFEPGIHWTQCQLQSGAADSTGARLRNPVHLSREQDPEGRFLRRWLPELEGVPEAHLHEPWRMSAGEQRSAGCRIGNDYPEPVVEPLAAARAAALRLRAANGKSAPEPDDRISAQDLTPARARGARTANRRPGASG